MHKKDGKHSRDSKQSHTDRGCPSLNCILPTHITPISNIYLVTKAQSFWKSLLPLKTHPSSTMQAKIVIITRIKVTILRSARVARASSRNKSLTTT